MIKEIIVKVNKMCLFHKYKIIKTERMRNVSFGFAGVECPAIRVVEQCSKCKKIKKTSLNMRMPLKYMKKEYDNMWK